VAREAWQTIFDLVFSGAGHDRFPKVCRALGISPPLLKTLFHLEPGRPTPMRDVAGHWGCDASWVTNLADGLEHLGLAERRPHPSDRRVKTLVLTRKGVAARQRAFDLLYEPPPSFDALTAAEAKMLRDLLRKLAAKDPELGLRITAAAAPARYAGA
jgi:DNA-binding MarR family transcriptional regulator